MLLASGIHPQEATMTSSTNPAGTPDAQRGSDDPQYRANLRRATLASSVGSALEYYDFALYGLASALIFGKLFFPALGPSAGLVASFAVYGVGSSPARSAACSSARWATGWAARPSSSPRSR
jgi:MHS family metabolite:H+ symporter-like MFS transporter